MSLLIESIKLVDGKFFNLPYHQERISRSFEHLFQQPSVIDLLELLSRQPVPGSGCYKCRIEYDAGSASVSFSPYVIREVKRVKVVEDHEISYSFKFVDRRAIDRLFALREDCDDVLIVRNGLVTDCSYSNVLFRQGHRWFTPGAPLLEGTMRAKLVRENKISVREIRKGDIRSFEKLKLINAMLEFEGPEIDVSDIVY